MTRQDDGKEMQNYRLEAFIQMAYEFVSPPLGNVDAVRGIIDLLYLNRMRNILDDPDFSFDEPDQGDVKSNEDASSKREIIEGRLGDFRISAEGFPERAEDFEQRFFDDVKNEFLQSNGVDAYATYLPIHFFFDGKQFSTKWGVYVSEEGMLKLAAGLRARALHWFGEPRFDTDSSFVSMAYEILLRHELVHFKVESFALNAELFNAASGLRIQPQVYVPYLENVYAPTFGSGWSFSDPDASNCCLGESIANATVLNSRQTVGKHFNMMYPRSEMSEQQRNFSWQDLICDVWFEHQQDCYRNFSLRHGPHPQKGQTLGGFSNRQLALSYLCNQVVTGQRIPETNVPFFAYSPDNYFLRAENLVPIYVVKSLRAEDSFIQGAPPRRKVWERFINELGYWKLNGRGKGDHQVWVNGLGLPQLTVDYRDGELSFGSFASALKALGIGQRDFRQYQVNKSLPDILRKRLDDARSSRF